jgi:hypothetical protein
MTLTMPLAPADAMSWTPRHPGVDDEAAVALEDAVASLAAGHDEFLHGHCVLLAIALHAQVGGALCALRSGANLVHAVVRDGDGVLIDLKGRRSVAWVEQDFEEEVDAIHGTTARALLRLNYGRRAPSRRLRAQAETLAGRLAPLVVRQRVLAGYVAVSGPRDRGVAAAVCRPFRTQSGTIPSHAAPDLGAACYPWMVSHDRSFRP